MRVDLFDAEETHKWSSYDHSFVRIRSVSALKLHHDEGVSVETLSRAWSPVLVHLVNGVVIAKPFALFKSVNRLFRHEPQIMTMTQSDRVKRMRLTRLQSLSSPSTSSSSSSSSSSATDNGNQDNNTRERTLFGSLLDVHDDDLMSFLPSS